MKVSILNLAPLRQEGNYRQAYEAKKYLEFIPKLELKML